jgi:antitoxin VapB
MPGRRKNPVTPPATAKVFMNGRSQAVRLPAEYRFRGDEVHVRRVGNAVILTEKDRSWDDFFATASRLPEDFLADRGDVPPQPRRRLL